MTNQLANVNSTNLIMTVNTDSVEGKLAVANAISAAAPLKDMDEEFKIADIIQTQGKRAQSDEPCINTYIITTDGEAFFSQSEGVARSAALIAGLFEGDFGEGVPCRTCEQKLDNGRTLRTLKFGA